MFTRSVVSNSMDYRFKFTIEDEDGNVVGAGSTYIIPESIQPMGTCESVDMEVGAAMRAFRKVYKIEHEADLGEGEET